MELHLLMVEGPVKITILTVLLATASLATVAFLHSTWRRRAEIQTFKRQRGCEDPPQYPHQDRVWGSDLAKIRMDAMKEGRMFKLYKSQFEIYGKTFEEIAKGGSLINTIEPANIQQIAAVACDDYSKDPRRTKAQGPFLGPSIFSEEGAQWKKSRELIKPIFNRAELSDIDQLAAFADRFMKLIPGNGNTFDIQPLLHRLFLDASTDFLFGKTMNSLQSETPKECAEFLQAFSTAQRWVGKRIEAGRLRVRYDYNQDWINAYTKIHKYVDQQVERALRENKQSEENSDMSLVRERYVLLDEMAKQIRDPIQLRYQVLGAFLPARDTTSIAVGNTLFQLARHSEVWTKLRRISLGIEGNLSFERLKSLVEFKHVVYETIRTVGPAARIWRVAIRDTVLPSGGGQDRKSPVFVAKGTTVVMNSWAINHDRDIWGDDVEEFKPDRWIGRKVQQWEFIPFFGGPRACPGQQQALTHAIYILVRLTREFESIENRDPVSEYIENFGMGFESRNGVKIALK